MAAPSAQHGACKLPRMALGVDSSCLFSREGRVGSWPLHLVEGVVAVSACDSATVARKGLPRAGARGSTTFRGTSTGMLHECVGTTSNGRCVRSVGTRRWEMGLHRRQSTGMLQESVGTTSNGRCVRSVGTRRWEMGLHRRQA